MPGSGYRITGNYYLDIVYSTSALGTLSIARVHSENQGFLHP
jgi:hypothetical protein